MILAVQGILKNLLQHHRSKASILWLSAFFMAQLAHPYITTGKTIALSRQIFVSKVLSLLFNTLSRFVITFLARSKHLLISWLQSPSAVIFGAQENEACHCLIGGPMARFCPSDAAGAGSNPGQGINIPNATWPTTTAAKRLLISAS